MKWCPCRNHIRATKNDARVDIWSDQIRRGHHSSQPSKQPSFYGGEIDSLPVIWFLSPSTRSYIRESSGLLPEACQKSLSKFSRLLVSFSILGDKFGWLLVSFWKRYKQPYTRATITFGHWGCPNLGGCLYHFCPNGCLNMIVARIL